MFVGLNETGVAAAAILKDRHIGVEVLAATSLVCMHQVHGNDVVLVKETECGVQGNLLRFREEGIEIDQDSLISNLDVSHPAYKGYKDQDIETVCFRSDALISNAKDIALAVKTADCLPIFLYGSGYMAVVHAGRQGTLLGITERVCRALQFLGVDHVDVWFGPASCVMCYEIDQDTHTHFNLLAENKAQIEAVFNKRCIRYVQGDTEYLCTQCASDRFFSYRSGDTNQRNVFYFSK
jgi:copper oxidase (laccase) domain-containing protein